MTSWFRRLLKRPESASPLTRASSPPMAQSAAPRWSRHFDVCVCHSAEDALDAQLLASHLEAGPHRLRCFLPLRDSAPGGAVPTELCEVVQGSHCWALLITPAFLVDPWCRYQMHQALAEAPMSNRIIPLLLRASQSDYPTELCFYYYIDLNRDLEQGYARVYKTILTYLAELCMSTTGVDHVPAVGSLRDPRSPGCTLTNPGFSETPPSSTREPFSGLALTTTECPELGQGCREATKDGIEERDRIEDVHSSL